MSIEAKLRELHDARFQHEDDRKPGLQICEYGCDEMYAIEAAARLAYGDAASIADGSMTAGYAAQVIRMRAAALLAGAEGEGQR